MMCEGEEEQTCVHEEREAWNAGRGRGFAVANEGCVRAGRGDGGGGISQTRRNEAALMRSRAVWVVPANP